MKIIKDIFAFFVSLGKALMLPIAVLPIAGLLLRFGQPDLLNIAFISQAGQAIFDNLPIIFALGVATGFAKENHGAAALSAFIGYVVMTAGLAVFDKTLNMGVLGGILIGVTAGVLYNRYKNIKLHSYIAFFGGRRFVPIVCGLSAIFYALIFAYIWPPISACIKGFGNWIIASGNIGLFCYGTANRLLIPLGLHHILNTFIWFDFGDYTTISAGVEVVKHGDLWRFFAGDPTAGAFMSGFFPVMMFGLPCAAFAMIVRSYKENRKVATGILVSLALTSFLTGITEPMEFAFMFLAFPLYVLHSILTGLSMVIMNILGVKLGFTFSAGLFDYLLNYGISTKPLWLLPIGIVYGLIYFFVFYFAIGWFNLKTPGREDLPNKEEVKQDEGVKVAQKEENKVIEAEPETRGYKYLKALGGKENIKTLGACATRLRLEVNSSEKVDEQTLKTLGARGVINKNGIVQVVIGPEADLLCDEIRVYIR